MYNGQLAGQLNPIMDPGTRALSQIRVSGTYGYVTNGVDPNAVRAQLEPALLQACNTVIAQKLAAQQVALPTLAGSFPHFLGDVVAATGAQAFGVQLTSLNLQLEVSAPVALPPDPMQATADAFKQRALEELDPRNKVYGVKVNVGGFKLKANTEDGFDGAGLADQVKEKAKSTVIWWGIGCLVLLFIAALLGGIAWYTVGVAKTSMAGGTAQQASDAKVVSWDGTTPFTCKGVENVKLEKVTAKLSQGVAITASGACRLELVDCDIEAPTAIKAAGNVHIVIQGGSVTGKTAAFDTLGAVTITMTGTKVTGPTKKVGTPTITGP